MICKICNSSTRRIFDSFILNKYNVTYYQCESCGFLQTEYPFWLSEAYSSPISDLDVGYVNRNLSLAEKTEAIINNHFDSNKKFLDYAGGYGLFVRIMRNKGLNFYWQDNYCCNLFAQHFEIDLTMHKKFKFEMITGFEILEHLVDPYQILNKIFEISDSFLFSTELQPKNSSTSNLQNWWYLAQEGGQHVSFYTIKSLNYIALKCSCNMYSDLKNLHLFTKRCFKKNPVKSKKNFFFPRKKESLLKKDFLYIKSLYTQK